MGVLIRFRNLKDMPCILKIPELVLTFVILIISREGGHAADSGSQVDSSESWSVPWGGTVDSNNLGAVTVYGFFLIVLGQTAGYLCGERSMVQNGLVNLVGAFSFLSLGSLQIKYFNENEDLWSDPAVAGGAYVALATANAVLAILAGFVFLADGGYCMVQVYHD